MTSLDEIQHKVNTEGGIGIICAKRRQVGLSGHIVPIVPETKFKKPIEKMVWLSTRYNRKPEN